MRMKNRNWCDINAYREETLTLLSSSCVLKFVRGILLEDTLYGIGWRFSSPFFAELLDHELRSLREYEICCEANNFKISFNIRIKPLRYIARSVGGSQM